MQNNLDDTPQNDLQSDLHSNIQTKKTFCAICEATCGLEVDVEDNQVVEIRANKDHVVSQGHLCVKGKRYGSIQHSPDRITEPLKRIGDQWQTIGWDQAINEIAAKIKKIKKSKGPQSIAHFVGAPGGANLLAPIFRGSLFAGIGSNRMYGTGTCDTMNKFRVNGDMYGSPMRLAYPDVDHTHFMMILGANPVVSGTTLYHLPRAHQRLADIVKRGGRMVVINPRKVETALAGEHIFIRPDTDIYFLAAFCNSIIKRNAIASDRIQRSMRNFEQLKTTVSAWTAERQAAVTGIDVSTFNDLVDGYINAPAAALNMATGVNQGRHGTLCYWLLESIAAITGNFDRKGGNLIGEGLIDFASIAQDDPQMRLGYHRRDDLPTVSGQQPAGMVADDILNGDVGAMIVEASNPLLACGTPNGRLEQAMEKLELLVCIDLFRNETGNLADYILPAPSWLERSSMPYALQSFVGCTPKPYVYASGPALDAPSGVRHEWWIYTRLADKLGVTMMGNRFMSGALKLAAKIAYKPYGAWVKVPEMLIDGMLKKAKMPSLKKMINDHPDGILLAENDGENFLATERVLTEDGLVNLAPAAYIETFAENVESAYQQELNNRDKLKLIGKREIRRMNSASANCEQLVKVDTNYAYLNPTDAARINVADAEFVQVRSSFGDIHIPVKISDEMMAGTIAIPQCWGHQKADGLRHASQNPGVNSNYLAGDGYENIEKLSGMSHLSGILVDIEKSDRLASTG